MQISQFYYGAAQPSGIAAQIAGALFYGQAQDNGSLASDPNVLDNGNIIWSGPEGDGAGVATDQTGSGTLYTYNWPCCGGNGTDFFAVNGVGRTFGLLQDSQPGNTPDPQWPFLGGSTFAVTTRGVYFMADSTVATPAWVNITGNLFNIVHNAFGDPTMPGTQMKALSSIVGDWRYTIADNNTATSPLHPILYVGGEGGVYRSLDKGTTWVLFPDPTADGAPQAGRYVAQ